jgi:hypothetical protein
MLGVIKHSPRGRKKQESREDEKIARKVNRVQVGVTLEAKQRIPEMARVVTERINAGESLRDPSRCQVDRKRESVHLDKECNDEGGETAEGAPVALGSRLEKAER